MRSKAARAVMVFLALLPGPALAGLPSPGRLVQVIVVVWDGAQRNHVQEMLDSHALPNLEAMIGNGGLWRADMVIHTTACEVGDGDGYTTMTCPAMAALVTGYGYPLNHCYSNGRCGTLADGTSIFERMKTFDPDIRTGMITSHSLTCWPSPVLDAAAEALDVQYHDLDVSGNSTTIRGLQFVDAYRRDPFLLVLHYGGPDFQGHSRGENSEQYDTILMVNDGGLGRIRARLADLGMARSTILLVTADHGFEEGAKNHVGCLDDDRNLWIASSRAAAIGNLAAPAWQTSMAPTIFDLFGMSKDVLPPFGAESLVLWEN